MKEPVYEYPLSAVKEHAALVDALRARIAELEAQLSMSADEVPIIASRALMEAMADWSAPVQIRAVRDGDRWSIEVRRIERPYAPDNEHSHE